MKGNPRPSKKPVNTKFTERFMRKPMVHEENQFAKKFRESKKKRGD